MTRKPFLTFVSVVMAASLPFATTAQAGKGAKVGLGILAGAVVLGAMANAAQKNKAKAKARARAKAKAQARARAKARAAAAAKKRKAAQQRAIAAKKRKAAQQRAIAAKKRKAAEQRAYAAKKAKQQKVAAAEAEARAEAEAQAKADAEKTEGAFVSAPSTAALLTSKDVGDAPTETAKTDTATEVAVVDKADTATEAAPVVENADAGEGGCKRFIPAVGLTVSVGC